MTTKWSDLKRELGSDPVVAEGYEKARLAYEFGLRVRRRREELSLTQSELARLVGTSQPAIARLEAGGTQPTLETIAALSRALRTTWLISPRGVECADPEAARHA